MDEEHTILKRMAKTAPKTTVSAVATLDDILQMRTVLDQIHVDEKIERYILHLVAATRTPEAYDLSDVKPYIRFGASPRATIYLTLAARGHAFLRGENFVVPDDVKAVLHDVVRHRIAISYRAEADGLNSDALLDRIVEKVPVLEKE